MIRHKYEEETRVHFLTFACGIPADFSVRESAGRAGDSMDIRWKIKLNQHEKAKTAHHLKKIWSGKEWNKSNDNFTNLQLNIVLLNLLYKT